MKSKQEEVLRDVALLRIEAAKAKVAETGKGLSLRNWEINGVSRSRGLARYGRRTASAADTGGKSLPCAGATSGQWGFADVGAA